MCYANVRIVWFCERRLIVLFANLYLKPVFQTASGYVGSVCFWASWIRNLLVWIWIWINKKKWKKPHDFYCPATSYDFLSLKNDVNVPSKRNRHKKFDKLFFCLLEGQWRKEQDPEPEPDPLVKGPDLRIRIRIRIRTKMSRIRNTALSHSKRSWFAFWLPLPRGRYQSRNCFSKKILLSSPLEILRIFWYRRGPLLLKPDDLL